MKNLFAGLVVAALAAGPVAAQEAVITYDTDQSFDDVIFGLENAILDEGLVVDHISHTGDMLERTRADPMNIVYCPYHIFVMVRPESPDTTTVGFRSFPEGEMKKIEALLDGIARSAVGLE